MDVHVRIFVILCTLFIFKLSESEIPDIHGIEPIITNVLGASQRFMREQKVRYKYFILKNNLNACYYILLSLHKETNITKV